VIENIVGDAVASGAEDMFVLSWHYENSAPLWQGCRSAHRSTGVRTTLIDSPGDLMDPTLVSTEYPGDFPGWAAEHAAVVETSLMLHLAPELVRKEAIPDGEPHLPKPWDRWPESDMAIPDDGVFAPAAASSAEYGQRLFASMTEGLSRLLSEPS
jgi:creatinine amidohydrolase